MVCYSTGKLVITVIGITHTDSNATKVLIVWILFVSQGRQRIESQVMKVSINLYRDLVELWNQSWTDYAN